MRRCLALGTILGSLAATGAGTGASPRIELRPCHVPGIEEAVRCGEMQVFENRNGATGRRIRIALTVFPAVQRNRRPDPLLLLAGGPGQIARGYARWAGRIYSEVRKTRDIVLIDARGTGGSNPLRCPEPEDVFESGLAGGGAVDDVRKCLETLDADPRWYGNETIVEDLEEAVAVLG